MADRGPPRGRPVPVATDGGTSDSVERVVSLLDDEYARAILEAAREEPVSAEELSERCDASPATVYRRLERLREQELLREEQRIDPDGHHYKVYETRVRAVTVEMGDDGFVCAVDRGDSEDAADRFTRLYEGFK